MKYALRQLVQRPGFTAVAVLILALGIGSNTAVFTTIDALLLRGLPVRDPEGLVLLSAPGSKATGDNPIDSYPYHAFEQFRDHAQSLDGIAAINTSNRSLIASGFGQTNASDVKLSGVSGNFFSFLGVPASLGRTLTPDDDRKDAPRPVVVLSTAFWRRKFGADPGVLGKTVQIDNVQFAIVGVAGPGFWGVEVGRKIDLWMPIQMYPIMDSGMRPMFEGPMAAKTFAQRIMARLRPGVKRPAADAELDLIFRSDLAAAGISPATLHEYGFSRIELQRGGSGYINGRNQVSSLLTILMVVVGLVLLVACANVASLLLARTAVRQREFALRMALGSGRWQLIRQLMTESLLLAAIGGLLGLLLAHWGTLALAGYMPGGNALNLSLDRRVVAFAIGVSALAGIFVGLVPALRFSRLDLVSAIKAQAATVAGGSSQRLNKALVTVQIAFSVCLLAGAGLFVHTLENLKNVDVGFNREHMLVAGVAFAKNDTAARRNTLSRDLLATFQGLPGVRGASFCWGGAGLLAGGYARTSYFGVVGYVPRLDEGKLTASCVYAGPHFLQTLGIPLLQGRGIEAADAFPLDRPTGPNAVGEVVVNESFARRFFGGKSPLGRQIHLPDDQTAAIVGIKPTAYSIIGVVKDTKALSLRDDGLLTAYFPCSALPFPPGMIYMELRTENEPLALGPAVRSTFHTVDPTLGNPSIGTIDQGISHSLEQEQMIADAAGTFSLFALLLASLGLYGVLAYNVTQRTREIGVRMALGARAGDIIAIILRQGLGLALVGCAVGTVAAIALEHLVSSRLYGVPAIDPVTFALTPVLLLAVALLACWLPARRATKVDPMIALRAE